MVTNNWWANWTRECILKSIPCKGNYHGGLVTLTGARNPAHPANRSQWAHNYCDYEVMRDPVLCTGTLYIRYTSLEWRHNERDGVSNHQRLDCIFNRLFWRSSKEAPKLRVTGLCEGNSTVTGEFPAQRGLQRWQYFHLMTSSCCCRYLCIVIWYGDVLKAETINYDTKSYKSYFWYEGKVNYNRILLWWRGTIWR